MRVLFKANLLAILAEDEIDQDQLKAWNNSSRGHVFYFGGSSPTGGSLHDLGLREDACCEPINITSKAPGELRLISNLAATSFILDGKEYASVESFWQGLKYPDEVKRREIAPLSGGRAKDSGWGSPLADSFIYNDQVVRIGTWDHWQLMSQACQAKFDQHEPACQALLATGRRPLVHRMKRDSRTIPGVIMAEIWMTCRNALRTKSASTQSSLDIPWETDDDLLEAT